MEIWEQWERDYEEGQYFLRSINFWAERDLDKQYVCSDCHEPIEPTICVNHAKVHCKECCQAI